MGIPRWRKSREVKRLLAKEATEEQVAREVGVPASEVRKWVVKYERGGDAALEDG
ncbi:hypothetical protein DMH03_03760 [Amycolatopsis sp. WAC 01376]|uniref:helix-turn-helix domain-containing protein n=1 Tax=Amycolatopsis sp. WAC 01376 TaxID=2203195 RepID=UPI000F78C759|nr:helix-turn-helix domain-containing protein [Amycolatopsis sp. WAC 01376]RSM66253.1 hypothetical protein DMH03_03760 [Amycolatopsis sp. WAC 01376]